MQYLFILLISILYTILFFGKVKGLSSSILLNNLINWIAIKSIIKLLGYTTIIENIGPFNTNGNIITNGIATIIHIINTIFNNFPIFDIISPLLKVYAYFINCQYLFVVFR